MLVVAVLALAGIACNNTKKQEGKEPPVAAPVVGSGSGSGSATAPAPDPKLIARGEYLSGIMGCPYCHLPLGPTGPDFTRPFAGGLEIPEKFGTWRAPNITPDKETGIGRWTDEQIAAAIREGKRPDGDGLFPIMPYLNYNRMTDDDVKALVAYLRSVKPIANKVERTKDLKLPKIPAPKPANAPDPATDPLKHGEYLVTLMHCDMCHTPMTDKGPDRTKLFAGGFEMEIPPLGTGKLYGSNITSDPETGIGKWSQADIEKAVKFLTRPDNTVIQGPMQFYQAGWSKLTDDDLKAIATYVKAIPAIKNKVPKSTFKPHAGPPPGAGSGSGAGSAGAGSGSAAKPATGSGSGSAK
jgi:mono/diheme cytochrome c family protein